jgi:hypothetical protein
MRRQKTVKITRAKGKTETRSWPEELNSLTVGKQNVFVTGTLDKICERRFRRRSMYLQTFFCCDIMFSSAYGRHERKIPFILTFVIIGHWYFEIFSRMEKIKFSVYKISISSLSAVL